MTDLLVFSFIFGFVAGIAFTLGVAIVVAVKVLRQMQLEKTNSLFVSLAAKGNESRL